jgi:pentatricopeptide repeat protein
MHEFPLPTDSALAFPELVAMHQGDQWAALIARTNQIIRDLPKDTPIAHRVRLDLYIVSALCRSGQVDQAATALDEMRDAVEHAGSEELRARWELSSSFVKHSRGDMDGAEVHAFACLASADLLRGSEELAAAAHGNIGLIAMHRGEWSTAKRHLSRSVSLSESIGDSTGHLRRAANLAVAHYWSGDLSEARETAQSALTSASASENPQTVVRLLILLGSIEHIQGNTASAMDHLEALRGVCVPTEHRREAALIEELAGDLALSSGNLAQAASRYEMTVSAGLAIAPIGDLVYEGKRKLAEVRRRQGRLDEAKTLAVDAYEMARAAGTVVEIGASLRVLSLTCEQLGERDAARQHARESLRVLRRVNERYERMQTLLGVADFMDDAGQLLLEARGLAADLGLDGVIAEIDARLASPAEQESPPPAPAQAHGACGDVARC